MSNSVFPSLPGLQWDCTRTPVWSTTERKSASGRSFRSANYAWPLYRVKLAFEFLRQGGSWAEMAQLAGFYNQHAGGFDSFLWRDPDDNAVTAQGFGTGDGAATKFQLVRAFGGFVEPVFDTNGPPMLYVASAGVTYPCTLVQNGDFEAQSGGQPYGYVAYNQPMSAVYTTPAPYSGSAAFGLKATSAGQGQLGIGTSNSYAGGGYTGGIRGGWVPGATYTVAFYARKVNGAAWAGMGFGWNTSPATTDSTGNPALTTAWQLFVFRITWGAAVESAGQLYITITGGATAINDEIQIDRLVVFPGSYSYSAPELTTSYGPSYLIGNGLVTFDAALGSGYQLSWTGSYYRRMRFVPDSAEFVKVMSGIWSIKSLEMESVKP